MFQSSVVVSLASLTSLRLPRNMLDPQNYARWFDTCAKESVEAWCQSCPAGFCRMVHHPYATAFYTEYLSCSMTASALYPVHCWCLRRVTTLFLLPRPIYVGLVTTRRVEVPTMLSHLVLSPPQKHLR